MVYLAGLGVLPRYYYQLGHTRFPRFSLGFLWKAAESLSQPGTVLLAGLGVLPRYMSPRYISRSGATVLSVARSSKGAVTCRWQLGFGLLSTFIGSVRAWCASILCLCLCSCFAQLTSLFSLAGRALA